MKSDERLMLEYQEGSYLAFEELYGRHQGKIYSYVRGKVAPYAKDSANDVFQIIFSKLHEKKSYYRYDAPFLPWLFVIARNTVIDFGRKNKLIGFHEAFDEFYNKGAKDPDRLEVKNELEDLSLSEEQFQLLYLKYGEELSYEQMEEELQVSSSALRKRVSRVLNKLRKNR